MFIRRVFYDAVTGASFLTYMQRGNFLYTPQDVDAQVRGISGDWRCLEWRKPVPELETMFLENRTLAVNIDTLELIWGEPGSALTPAPPPEEDPFDDAVAALETLGYTEEGGDT